MTHRRASTRKRKDLEGLRQGVEANKRIRSEITQPDLVLLVDIHGVWARAVTRQPPLAPGPAGGIVHGQLTGVPFTDPQPPLRVGPHPPRTLPGRRWLEDGHASGFRVDAAELAPGERGVVDPTLRCGGDPIRSAPLRRVEDLHPPLFRIQSTVHAGLAGEP